MGDCGADVNTWTNVVRRARLGTTTKAVALTLASYANRDGSKVFPGLDRMAWQCEIGYSTAKRAVEKLRRAGLIEKVGRGARKRGQADEYRLILAEDLMDRCEVPSPAQERLRIEEAARARHEPSRAHQRALETHSGEAPEGAGNPSEHPPGRVSQGSPASPTNGSRAQPEQVLGLAGDPPPSIENHYLEKQPPSLAPQARTAVTATRAREAANNPEDSSKETDMPNRQTASTTPAVPQHPDAAVLTCVVPGCGGRYRDTDDSRASHRAVFGHTPQPATRSAA